MPPQDVDDQGYGSTSAAEAPPDLNAGLAAVDSQGTGFQLPYGSALGGIGNQVQATTPVNVPGYYLRGTTGLPGPLQTAKPYTVTYQQVVDSIRTSRDRNVITRVQRELYDAGMYDADFYDTPKKGEAAPQPAWGYVDGATLSALNSALGYSVVRNMSLPDALAESRAVHMSDLERRRQAEKEARDAELAKIYPPQVYFAQTAMESVPDADALGLIVDSAARELIGREITDDEKSRVVSSIMAQAQQLAAARGAVEAGNQRGIGEAQGLEYQMRVQAAQAEAAGTGAPDFSAPAGAQVIGEPGGGQTFITGGGVNITENVDPQAEAARQVEERFAGEAKQYALTRQVNTLLSMLTRGAGAGGQG